MEYVQGAFYSASAPFGVPRWRALISYTFCANTDSIFPFIRDRSIGSLRTLFSALPASVSDQASQLRSDYVDPYIVQPLSMLLTSSSSDILSIVILLVILYISLRVLDYARRIVMFWVLFVVRFFFWATLVAIGVYVYNVGLERATREAGWLWGVAQGFIEDFIASTDGTGNRSRSGGSGGSSGGYRAGSGYQRGGKKW
jgi:hypothetical protein